MKIGLILFLLVLKSIFVEGQENMDKTFRMATINIRVSLKKDSLNNWSNRKERIEEFIKQEDLDIACLQEVAVSQLNYLDKKLTNYEFVGNKTKPIKGEEYLPIFYKKDSFKCLDKGIFWLSEMPDSVSSKSWDAKNVRRVTWIKLKWLKNKGVFYIVNTHLDHIGETSRLEGMKLIKRRISVFAEEAPCIICGDMNFSAITEPYYIALNNDFIMYNAYQIAKSRQGVTYTYHGFGNRKMNQRNMTDYIFVTNQVKVDSIFIPKEQKKDGVYLSDHCPIIATIGFL